MIVSVRTCLCHFAMDSVTGLTIEGVFNALALVTDKLSTLTLVNLFYGVAAGDGIKQLQNFSVLNWLECDGVWLQPVGALNLPSSLRHLGLRFPSIGHAATFPTIAALGYGLFRLPRLASVDFSDYELNVWSGSWLDAVKVGFCAHEPSPNA